MDRTELESKHLAELHELAAEAGIERYRMMSRGDLIEKLAGGSPRGGGRGGSPRGGGGGAGDGGGRAESGRSEPRERRERQGRGGRDRQRRDRPSRGERPGRERRPEAGDAPEPTETAPPVPEPTGTDRVPESEESKPRRRRRRRFRRRGGKTVRVNEMLLPAAPGRQAIVYAETRESCTALLRELAAELSGGRGPDPVALLVDPSPEELADWKREAPKAEIVSAGQERHAEDALAQAARRAESGEPVIFLIDSLSRLAESFGGSRTAKQLFDAGVSAGGPAGGSLTVVAAVERPG
jgi:transcription termination factor Rho